MSNLHWERKKSKKERELDPVLAAPQKDRRAITHSRHSSRRSVSPQGHNTSFHRPRGAGLKVEPLVSILFSVAPRWQGRSALCLARLNPRPSAHTPSPYSPRLVFDDPIGVGSIGRSAGESSSVTWEASCTLLFISLCHRTFAGALLRLLWDVSNPLASEFWFKFTFYCRFRHIFFYFARISLSLLPVIRFSLCKFNLLAYTVFLSSIVILGLQK